MLCPISQEFPQGCPQNSTILTSYNIEVVISDVCVQSCRGGQLDPGQEVKVIHSPDDWSPEDEVDGPVRVPEVIVSPAPCFKDFLIMCATPPG